MFMLLAYNFICHANLGWVRWCTSWAWEAETFRKHRHSENTPLGWVGLGEESWSVEPNGCGRPN